MLCKHLFLILHIGFPADRTYVIPWRFSSLLHISGNVIKMMRLIKICEFWNNFTQLMLKVI